MCFESLETDMSSSSVSTFQSYFQLALKHIRNPNQLAQQASKTAENTSPGGLLARMRNMNQAQMIAGGVVFAEMLGFFTVGEMIGRMKLVGYRGDTGAHH